MKISIYINRNHPILKYGQTGVFDSKNSRFYPHGGATCKTTKGKTESVLYLLTERNHVWFDEDGYVDL
jgi:hypothetical protein